MTPYGSARLFFRACHFFVSNAGQSLVPACTRTRSGPVRPAARLHAIHNPALFQLFEPLPELSPSAGLSAGKERICRMAVTVVLAVFTARPAAVDFIQRIPAVVGDACRRFMAMDGYL